MPENPMMQMLLLVFLGNIRKWIKDDPEKAIVELDKAIALLEEQS